MIRDELRAFAFTLWLLGTSACWAQPSVSNVSPQAVRPGATVELTFRGEHLQDPLQVWTSFPATVEMLPADAEAEEEVKSRTCRLKLEDDVAGGIGGIVVGSPDGASDVQYVMIDDLGTVTDQGNNHSIGAAQQIDIPTGVEGVVDGPQFDYYRFAGSEGQRLSVEVIAARLGSELDAVVRLLRPDGRELIVADDDASFGADCRFSLQLPDDGEYLLEVRDNRYRSGGQYRLHIGDFPLVTVPYPLGGRRGTTRRFEFAGLSHEETMARIIRVPDQRSGNRHSIAAKFPDGVASSTATLLISDLPEAVEDEPNDRAELATPVTPPVAINGRFDPEGDQDSFAFAAVEDQSLAFTATSRSLGSPSIVYMRLYDAENNQLAESPVTDNDDWTLNYEFPADGMYRLVVEDLLRRGGPEHAYRIEVRPSVGFNLSIKPEESTRFHPPGNHGAFALTLQCDRQGYDGPVELSLQDVHPGFTLLNGVVPAGAQDHRLIIAVSDSVSRGTLHPLRIIGHAAERNAADGNAADGCITPGRSVTASNVAARRAQNPQMIFPPQWSDGLVFAAIGDESPPFYSVAMSNPTFAFDRESGEARSTLSLERTNDEYDEAITVLVENLPAGFAFETNAEDDDYEIVVTGPQNAPEANHTLQIISYGEFNGQGVAHAQEVTLKLDAADDGKPNDAAKDDAAKDDAAENDGP